MRNGTSDLRIPRSDAQPLSHRDSTVSEVYCEVHMLLVSEMLIASSFRRRKANPSSKQDA